MTKIMRHRQTCENMLLYITEWKLDLAGICQPSTLVTSGIINSEFDKVTVQLADARSAQARIAQSHC